MKALILTIGLILVFVSQVWAQNTPLKAARDEYQFQTDSYRKAFDKYVVDKAAYDKNQSNTNQEILILSAKQLLAAQAQVWFSFFKALGIDLRETTGKTEAAQEIGVLLEEKQAELTNSLSGYNGLTDKPGLVVALNAANEAAGGYRLLGARAQALIKFYRVRHALDQLVAFKNTLGTLIPEQIINEIEKESQLRALAEAENLLTKAEAAYTTALTEFSKAPQSSAEYMLDQAIEDLTPIHTDLTRAQKILKEASRGIEL